MLASAGQQDRAAQHGAGALAVQHAAEHWRGERGEQAAERHGAGDGDARPAEVARHRLDEDRQRGDGAALAREAGATDAAEHDPAVEERQAAGQQQRQGSGGHA